MYTEMKSESIHSETVKALCNTDIIMCKSFFVGLVTKKSPHSRVGFPSSSCPFFQAALSCLPRPSSSSLFHISIGTNCYTGMSGKEQQRWFFMLLLGGGKMSLRLMAQYPELERNENRLGATEVCSVRLMCLVKNTHRYVLQKYR